MVVPFSVWKRRRSGGVEEDDSSIQRAAKGTRPSRRAVIKKLCRPVASGSVYSKRAIPSASLLASTLHAASHAQLEEDSLDRGVGDEIVGLRP